MCRCGRGRGHDGVLLGFIFGLPRSLTGAGVEGVHESKKEPDSRRQRFISNTNLEQISDWLTKIIIGVGLVELKEIPGALGALETALVPSLGSEGAPYAVAMTVTCLWLGFFIAYMWTRVRLLQVLEESHREIEDSVEQDG
jgi:hypothetical protein